MSVIQAFVNCRSEKRMIGVGTTRAVYEIDSFPDVVFKEPRWSEEWCQAYNELEFKVWQRISTEFSSELRWFAPIVEYDPASKILAMRRTTPLPDRLSFNESIRPSLPLWFVDRHYGNVGLIENNIVFHDYPDIQWWLLNQ